MNDNHRGVVSYQDGQLKAGARVRTRLHLSPADETVLLALGTQLGSLAGSDLATPCCQGRLDAKSASASRRERKRALTSSCSSALGGCDHPEL